MGIIPPAPRTVLDTCLYQRLVGLTLTGDGLVERLAAYLNAVEPMLELVIAGPFRDYTLHNAGHARKLVHLAEHLIEPTSIERLTALDIAVYIMACYLHDLGMVLTSGERARIVASSEFEDELRQSTQLWNDMVTTRDRHGQASDAANKLALELRLFQLQEAGLANYLRKRHASRDRYLELTALLKEESGRDDLFSHRDVSFETELIAICESHGRDVGVLLEAHDAYTDSFPREQAIGGTTLNVQFCAGLLRLADVLDFDRERTPRVLFESLGIETSDIPGAGVSLREWNKHMAVQTLRLGPYEIVISADSHQPAIEQSIRAFCTVIEREVRDTTAVLRRNPANIAEAYKLRVPLTVRAEVRAIGYIYKDLSFSLDQGAVTNLLMGDRLYPVRTVALRELVQNGIDACRVRALLESGAGYEPGVHVTSHCDGEQTWVVVSDNGIGMDDAVLFEYFFRVGRSYYTSPEFERLRGAAGGSFSPISRFGIGILSVFMIADRLEVRTRNAYSPRGDATYRTVRVDSRFGLAFVTEEDTGPHGTEVRIRLNAAHERGVDRFLREAGIYLRDNVRRPAVPTTVDLGIPPFTARANQFVALRTGGREELARKCIEPVVLDLSRWSERLSGRAILFFAVGDGGRLSNGGRRPMAHEFRYFMDGYSGNRLTVNGIVMQVKKLNQVFRVRGQHLVGVLDADLIGGRDIEYTVTRQRVSGRSVTAVRNELRRAIVEGLDDLGVTSRLVSNGPVFGAVGQWDDTDSALLDAVESEVPELPWPLGLHKDIAERLHISNGSAYRALSALIEAGRIAGPPRAEGFGPRV